MAEAVRTETSTIFENVQVLATFAHPCHLLHAVGWGFTRLPALANFQTLWVRQKKPIVLLKKTHSPAELQGLLPFTVDF